MPLTPHDAARKALIAYRQLQQMVKDRIGGKAAAAYIKSYNRILKTLTECFAVDDAFKEAVSHLRPLDDSTDHLSYQMECDARMLLAAAHGFIELYLSAEDKAKAIGFGVLSGG